MLVWRYDLCSGSAHEMCGRAAMFGVIGFVMAYKYPGTIPALKFFPHYEGELPGAPFAGDWHISETASQWAW